MVLTTRTWLGYKNSYSGLPCTFDCGSEISSVGGLASVLNCGRACNYNRRHIISAIDIVSGWWSAVGNRTQSVMWSACVVEVRVPVISGFWGMENFTTVGSERPLTLRAVISTSYCVFHWSGWSRTKSFTPGTSFVIHCSSLSWKKTPTNLFLKYARGYTHDSAIDFRANTISLNN